MYSLSTRLLFSRFSVTPAWAWLWLIVRLYVGYNWIEASLGKLSSPAWMQTGAALKGFWQNAVTQGAGTAHPAIAFGWYRAFIETLLNGGSYVWFAKLVAIGEFVVGVHAGPGHIYRHCRLPGRLLELELHDGRHGEHQPGALHTLDLAAAGLEDCRLVGAWIAGCCLRSARRGDAAKFWRYTQTGLAAQSSRTAANLKAGTCARRRFSAF